MFFATSLIERSFPRLAAVVSSTGARHRLDVVRHSSLVFATAAIREELA